MIPPSAYDTLSATEAIALQKQMRAQVCIQPLNKDIVLVGGADISFNKFETTVYAGIVVLRYPQMEVVDRVSVIAETTFPYISGLLAFREVPALLQAWSRLQTKPDVLVLDGHGISHPRRVGIATHFGLVADIPTIGCAKTKLTGSYDEPSDTVLAESPLTHQHETVGTVLRTKLHCKPVFISPGNKITLEQSVDLIKNCIRKYRIPEPTRLAHLLVNEARIKAKQNNPGELF